MPEGTTGRFTDPQDYQRSLPDMAATLVVSEPGPFEANLTWVRLPNVHLLQARESLARVAYIALPATLVFFSFPIQSSRPLFWNGVGAVPGDLRFHSPGERLHQRTIGPCHWGFVAFEHRFFVRYASALAGRFMEPPAASRTIRPKSVHLSNLLDLHAKVARVFGTKPATILHPEVGRALEYELVQAVAACLGEGEVNVLSRTRLKHAAIMRRFQDALGSVQHQNLRLADLCRSIDVSERTLRACCVDALGLGPSTYMRLRRLTSARAALLAADPASARTAEIARRFGFREMGRFAAEYRGAFGESPSATLHRRKNLPPRAQPPNLHSRATRHD